MHCISFQPTASFHQWPPAQPGCRLDQPSRLHPRPSEALWWSSLPQITVSVSLITTGEMREWCSDGFLSTPQENILHTNICCVCFSSCLFLSFLHPPLLTHHTGAHQCLHALMIHNYSTRAEHGVVHGLQQSKCAPYWPAPRPHLSECRRDLLWH